VPRIKHGTLSDFDLEYLSLQIGEWRPLARRLLFSEERIKGFYRASNRFREMAYMMLMQWKQREGSKASYKVLYDALCHELVGRRVLAEKFCIDDGRPSLVST